MMRFSAIGVLVLAGTTTVVAQTASNQPASSDTKKGNQPLTLVGCVNAPDAMGQILFSDSAEGTVYRLSGIDLRKYAGQRVQIVGGPSSKRLHVAGGLVPSANAAAQAGDLDPNRAAIANAEAASSAARRSRAPEFRVKSVQTMSGGCPQK
jgi:hypothetical protein